ncbi:nucleotide exchange factor GrpE [Fidelibacter multiformis]|uniref:nucleotide exchange factor GrpE n=1 Tax=Fidelibacter multiformis TaxID=3377529 RepID=UPI0037DC9A91
MKKDETPKDNRDHEILEDENPRDVNKGKTKSKGKGKQKTSEEKSQTKKEEPKQSEAEETEQAKEKETDPLQILMDQLSQTEEQKKDLEDKFIRLVAEFDNYKKRMSRDFDRQSEMVRDKIILSLLPVMDDLDRLLQHEGENGNVSLEGIKLIRNNFERILNNYGVKAFESVGQPFDPEKHDAMMTRKSEEHDVPTVIEEFEKGYEINDKVLRHARVVVSAAE